MSPTVVLLVQALDCPVEIWKRLERQYEKRTAASKLSLVQKYFGAKMYRPRERSQGRRMGGG